MKFTPKSKTIMMIALTICLSLFIINVVAEAVSKWDAANQKTYTGTVKIKNGQTLLKYGKITDILSIAPPAALDSLQLHPAEGDTLAVMGIMNKGIIVASQVTWNGKTHTLRDSIGKPVWPGRSTWASNPKICIGCRLCFMNCPADAITMVNNKSVIDQSKCSGCNTCIVGNGEGFAGCPVKAITK